MARDDLTGAALLRRPKTKVSLTADWQATRRLRLGASLIRVGAWRDFDRSGSFVTPGEPFTTVDVSADYDVGHGLTLFGKVTNLFDRQYESPVGFAKPGIGAVIGVRAAWRP
jgi:vitamin B12 transporter